MHRIDDTFAQQPRLLKGGLIFLHLAAGSVDFQAVETRFLENLKLLQNRRPLHSAIKPFFPVALRPSNGPFGRGRGIVGYSELGANRCACHNCDGGGEEIPAAGDGAGCDWAIHVFFRLKCSDTDNRYRAARQAFGCSWWYLAEVGMGAMASESAQAA